MNRPWTRPWPSSDRVNRAAAERCGFLGLQQLGLVGLGDLGGHDLQDPPPQDLQRLRVVLTRRGDQVAAGGVADLGVDRLRGQGVDGVDDDLGLVGQHPALGQGVTDRLVLPVQRRPRA